MKTSRAALKALVKECLLEILRDGLGSAAGAVSESAPQRRQPLIAQSLRPQAPPPRASQSVALRQAIKETSGGNAVLADILADTAATTLPEMLKGERGGSPPVAGGKAELLVAQASPEQLFGEESTARWADLAFDSSFRGAGVKALNGATD